MRMHITTNAPELAAREIMQHMESNGGEWIVNAVEKEGYILARGPYAKQLLRSGSRTLVGPIDATVPFDRLHGMLRLAHSKSLGEAPRKKRPSESNRDVPIKPGTQQRAWAEMQKRNWTVRELADQLGVTRGIAMNAVQKLLRSRRVAVVERIETPGNNKPTCVYGKAA